MAITVLIGLTFVVVFLILILATFLIYKHTKLVIKYNRIFKYLYNYLNIITSARYGNLNSRIEDGVDALTIQLSKNTNALLESINDRDKMINEYIEKEKQSQNIKQDFISSLAHDLKVPIIAQENTYDLFLNGSFGNLSDTQLKAIKNLKISNNDLKNLIIDLLDAQKLDSKELELNIEKTNINSLIKEVIVQNQSILSIKNKKIILNEKEQNIIYPLDKFLFKRVMNNLISNAIFYGKNTENIYINIEQVESSINISVIDEGDGINKELIDKLFKKYYTSSKKYSNIGVGLGLYIVNKILSAHKAKITAKNIENKGACFTITLDANNI